MSEERRDTGYKDKYGVPIHEGDRVRWDGGEYIITFSEWEEEWILKDDRDDWDCPTLSGTSSPQMSRFEIIEAPSADFLNKKGEDAKSE